MRKTIAERIEQYSIPEPNSGCLLWTGATNPGGYAILSVAGRSTLVHRITGNVPVGLVGRHKCDVTCCINGDHIISGTHGDNVADKVAKNRQHKGTQFPWAKLNEEKARAIKADPRRQQDIADDYGVHNVTISAIKTGKLWKHV